MKRASLLSLAFLMLISFLSIDVSAQRKKSYKPKTETVKSYVKKDGTRVKSYRRSKKS